MASKSLSKFTQWGLNRIIHQRVAVLFRSFEEACYLLGKATEQGFFFMFQLWLQAILPHLLFLQNLFLSLE